MKPFSDADGHSLSAFQNHATSPAGGMAHYVVYKHPRDAPAHWVVRRWEAHPSGEVRNCEGYGFKTLEDARTCIPEWARRLDRSPGDHAAIYEVWI